MNPLLADANLHGGIAQGLGGAMYEQIAYDEAGQPLTATFMDYTIPTAVEIPKLEIGHQETPSPFTPLGTKGVGESGVGGTLGALCSAIENALPELDLRLTELPLTPSRVWEAIQAAKANGPARSRRSRQESTDAAERVRVPCAARSPRRSACSQEHGDGAKVLAGGMSLMPADEPRPRPAGQRSSRSTTSRGLDCVEDDGETSCGSARWSGTSGSPSDPLDPSGMPPLLPRPPR